jgi:hypothetical protein
VLGSPSTRFDARSVLFATTLETMTTASTARRRSMSAGGEGGAGGTGIAPTAASWIGEGGACTAALVGAFAAAGLLGVLRHPRTGATRRVAAKRVHEWDREGREARSDIGDCNTRHDLLVTEESS